MYMYCLIPVGDIQWEQQGQYQVEVASQRYDNHQEGGQFEEVLELELV